MTRFGIEEYVSDCVIVLDHRVHDEVSTRRLRVVKYRGSLHGTNEYPFLITDRGLVVVPITSVTLEYDASSERVSTGITELDEMLDGGVYRGSSVLISGTAGTGKTSVAAHMAEAACARGERVLFVSMEESPAQLVRNMASIGIDLKPWLDSESLFVQSVRPTAFGLEEHLAMLHRLLDDVEPSIVVLDAVAGLAHAGGRGPTAQTLVRDLDLMKSREVTSVMTTLSPPEHEETTDVDVSSLVDTWLLLRNQESNGERNRVMYVIKSRGSAHSNQMREFVLTDHGAQLVDVQLGPEGVLTGSARVEQEERARQERREREAQHERRRRQLARRSAEIEEQIASLQAQLADETAALESLLAEESERQRSDDAARALLARGRSRGRPDGSGSGAAGGH
jgi:circadian clock protein KaiC